MHYSIKSILTMSPVMPVLVINKVDKVEHLFESLIKGNLKVVEITLRTSCALKVIEIASKKFPSLMVGAGTVLNEKDLQDIKSAGASFAVSPGSTISLATKALDMKFPFLPGIANSSDIMNLISLGYKSFKFFPAEAAGGINYIKSLNGPFPDIVFCPTGGVNQENATEWLKQNNVICVGGSWIIPSNNEDYNEIERRALLASKLRS
ncbi:bifunctional 4-hydroxy-2-oxoglutarate aldolase/2-dehydro-3-deoxy-phosphogluconate aldolase [Candidatus Levibacter sp. Uisw_134_01]|uniref:bifunctional 4-hydroxy-2-oxoglutarate aldolase/2-dehydro-3-deoxy-phosphogluconate aldolase n=1 Tax=Candidatus Levibacter sp. Uisw_134_01 TaxID=3230999 RepID=UPI003D4E1F83